MARRRLPTPLRWLLSLLAVLLVLVVAMSAVGALQPAEHEARVSATIPRPVGEVWSVLTDVKSHPAWRSELSRVALMPSADAHEHWMECDAQGSCTELVTTEISPPTRWVRTIPQGNGPFFGTWEHTLAEVPGGTQIIIIERGTVPNPFFRFVSTFMLGHTFTLEQFLAQLCARMSGESHGH